MTYSERPVVYCNLGVWNLKGCGFNLRKGKLRATLITVLLVTAVPLSKALNYSLFTAD